MDLILGRFADEHIERLDTDELTLFEKLLDIDDRDLLRWVTGETAAPAEYDSRLFRKIRAYEQGDPAC